MNILFLFHRIPYSPNKGGKIRTFHQIGFLARNHRVFVGCLVDSKEELGYVRELGKICTAVAASYRPRALSAVAAAGVVFSEKSLSVACFDCSELWSLTRGSTPVLPTGSLVGRR